MNTPDNVLRWQDKILQVMYWLHGKNLAQAVTTAQLNRFLHLEPTHIETAMQHLCASGLVCAQADEDGNVTTFQLTTPGLWTRTTWGATCSPASSMAPRSRR